MTRGWERVPEARRAWHAGSDATTLRRLESEAAPGETMVSGDEVLVRQPQKRQLWELRTAWVSTAMGSRYVSGTGSGFPALLWAVLLLCGARTPAVTLIADEVRCIWGFVAERLATLPRREFVLDWCHLAKRWRELTSMIGRDREARRELSRALRKRLCRGEVKGALDLLEEYPPQAKNAARLEQLVQYLGSRRELVVNCRQRRVKRE